MSHATTPRRPPGPMTAAGMPPARRCRAIAGGRRCRFSEHLAALGPGLHRITEGSEEIQMRRVAQRLFGFGRR